MAYGPLLPNKLNWSLIIFKSRVVLHFFTWVVQKKRPLNGCSSSSSSYWVFIANITFLVSWYQARSPGGEASVSAAALQSWRTDDVWYSWWRHRRRQRGRRWWRPRGPLSLPRPSTANRLQHPLSAFSETLHASIHIIFSPSTIH